MLYQNKGNLFQVLLSCSCCYIYCSIPICLCLLVCLGVFSQIMGCFGFSFCFFPTPFLFSFQTGDETFLFWEKYFWGGVCFPFFFWLFTENIWHRLSFALSCSHSCVLMANYTSPLLSCCFVSFMYLQIAIKSLASLSSACDLTEIFILPGSWIALLILCLQMVWESCNWEHHTDALGLLTPESWSWYLCSCGSLFSFWPFYCIASS